MNKREQELRKKQYRRGEKKKREKVKKQATQERSASEKEKCLFESVQMISFLRSDTITLLAYGLISILTALQNLQSDE